MFTSNPVILLQQSLLAHLSRCIWTDQQLRQRWRWIQTLTCWLQLRTMAAAGKFSHHLMGLLSVHCLRLGSLYEQLFTTWVIQVRGGIQVVCIQWWMVRLPVVVKALRGEFYWTLAKCWKPFTMSGSDCEVSFTIKMTGHILLCIELNNGSQLTLVP